MFCKKCGKEIPDHSDYCKYCGAYLKYTVSEESAEVTTMTSNPTKKKKLVFTLCLIAFILATLIFVFLPLLSRMVLGEAEYYILKESKLMTEMFSLHEIFNPQDDSKNDIINDKVHFKTSLELPIEGEGAELGLTMEGNIDRESERTLLNFIMHVNGENYNIYRYDINKNIVAESSPDFSDEVVVIDMNETEGNVEGKGNKDDDKAEMQEFQDVFASAAISALEKFSEVSNMKSGIHSSSFRIDADGLNETVKIFIEELNRSTAFKKIADNIIQSDGTLSPEALAKTGDSHDEDEAGIEMFMEVLKQLLKGESVFDFEGEVEFMVNYDWRGKVVERQLFLPDGSQMVLATVSEDKTDGLNLMYIPVSDECDTLEANYSKTIDKDSHGAINLDIISGDDYITASFENLQTKNCHGVYVPLGAARVSFNTLDENTSFSLDADCSGSIYTITYISSNDEGYEDFELVIDSRLSDEPDFSEFKEYELTESGDEEKLYQDFMSGLFRALFGDEYERLYGDYRDLYNEYYANSYA